MSQSKKTILVLTPRFPYPIHGGDKLRIHNVCKELAKGHRLILLSFCDTKSELTYPVDRNIFAETHRVYQPRWKSWSNSLLALFHRTPLQLAYYHSEVFAAKVSELSARSDLVLCHLIRTAQYAEKIKSIPRIIEMTDAISMNYWRVRSLGIPKSFKQLLYYIEAPRVASYEQSILKSFSRSVVVAPADAQYLSKTQELGDRLKVISNGVELKSLPFENRAGCEKIAFIGNFTTAPNQDAALFFCERILPEIRRRFPQISLKIIGVMPGAFVRRLKAFDGLEVTGKVDSVADAAQDCFCGICPMRIGAGIQNKILEYFSLGLAAISTSLGLQGIAATPQRELLVADSPEQFNDAISLLYLSAEKRMELAASARQFVESKHDWSVVLQSYATIVNEMLEPLSESSEVA